MCKVSYFHCKRISCGEDKHFVDEPQYCATYENSFHAKTLFKKAKPRPAWIPTKGMVNTNLVSFDMTINGLRYINYDRDTPVDCKEIEYVEQTAVESCGFERKYEVQEKACLFIMNKRKQKEAEKEDAERKKRNKFTYWN